MLFRFEQTGKALAKALEEIAARRTHGHWGPDYHLEVTLALTIAERTRLGSLSAKFVRVFARHLKPVMATGRHTNNNARPCYSLVTAG